jgi:hypothetical protein
MGKVLYYENTARGLCVSKALFPIYLTNQERKANEVIYASNKPCELFTKIMLPPTFSNKLAIREKKKNPALNSKAIINQEQQSS